MLYSISVTVVQQSTKIETLYFSADLEMAVWVTQVCVIMPQINSSVTLSPDRVDSRVVLTKLSANSLMTMGALGAAAAGAGGLPHQEYLC